MISDHLSWRTEQSHFRLLEKKISIYLDFVRTGQVFEPLVHYYDAAIRINLVHRFSCIATSRIGKPDPTLRTISMPFPPRQIACFGNLPP